MEYSAARSYSRDVLAHRVGGAHGDRGQAGGTHRRQPAPRTKLAQVISNCQKEIDLSGQINAIILCIKTNHFDRIAVLGWRYDVLDALLALK